MVQLTDNEYDEMLDKITKLVQLEKEKRIEFDIKKIAKAIGYNFWKCESDQEAINCGMDCAKQVIKALEE